MFTEAETWSGGRIELLVALGPSSVERQLMALRSVRDWLPLRGPYAESSVEPECQPQAQVALGQSLYGVATLPNSSRVAFATSLLEDEEGAWLYAGVPLGSLGAAYPVGAFPFGSGFAPWQHEVYAWLFGLAQHMFSKLEFDRGVIGWLTAVDVDKLVEHLLPEKRYHGYLRAEEGLLQYYPPTQSGAQIQ